ncbi:MAG: ABC transporter ATP-binding protein [Deltaproteobacteria bacterium]|nr:ABC transporter ATP-binding protein [Deltaproteobacteria bacterium]
MSTPSDSENPSHFTTPDPSMERVLVADDVTVRLGGKLILDGISFWIPKGEFVCLCGPNGAGKSTFLKTVLGIIEPTSGAISILGKPAGVAQRAVGYVPQRKTFDQDFPATALELIVANLRGKWPIRVHDAERERARAVLQRVGGEALIDKPLAGLSGGETQRVFLARALVTDPALIILDEPTAGVDVRGRQEFLDILWEISASDELAAILVTHNPAAIARCAERVVYIEKKLIAWGLPDELLGKSSLSAISYARTTRTPGGVIAPDED